jgi:hypothetical protein
MKKDDVEKEKNTLCLTNIQPNRPVFPFAQLFQTWQDFAQTIFHPSHYRPGGESRFPEAGDWMPHRTKLGQRHKKAP